MILAVLLGLWVLLMSISMIVGVLVPFQGIVIGLLGIAAGSLLIYGAIIDHLKQKLRKEMEEGNES